MFNGASRITDIRANAPRTKRLARGALSRYFKTFVSDAECYLTPKMHICDRHHFSLGAWVEAFADQIIDTNSLLVHVDSHDDLGHAPDVPLPQLLLRSPKDLRSAELARDGRNFVRALSNTKADPESSFIVPALAMGLFDRMIHVYEGKYAQKGGRVHLQIEDVAGKKYFTGSWVRLDDARKEGLPWKRTNMNSFRSAIEGFEGQSVLDLDLDYFNFASGNLQLAVREFCENVMLPLKPNFMTIALSRKYSFYDLSEQPRMIKNLLDFCFKNRILVD